MCLKQGGGDEAHAIESCRKSRPTEFAPPGAGRNPTFNKVFFNFQLSTDCLKLYSQLSTESVESSQLSTRFRMPSTDLDFILRIAGKSVC
jgi:hypothetical protein